MASSPPRIELPTPAQLEAAAAAHHLELSADEVDDFLELLETSVETHRRLEALPDPPRPGQPPGERDPGYRPGPEEDPLNAFITRCEVAGAHDGPLAGVAVGLKDNIALAGVELTAASRVLEGYVPPTDATVVTRLLDAGATVVGKLNMDDMAWSGTGDLGFGGPVLNPRNPEHVAGGSSSGCAVAVVTGDVDLAIGTDQAGSIRFPAAWCGCVGLKPTHGLVPYTGIIASGPTYDHVGPLARTVEECARGLEVMAGPDPLDPRQRGIEAAGGYTDLADEPEDVSVGAVGEGFGHGDEAVDTTVRAALSAFGDAGAEVVDVSVPWHLDGPVVWLGVTSEEGVAMARAERQGHYLQGYYDVDLLGAHATARREHGDRFPPTVRLKLTYGQYLMDTYHGYHHAKAQNLRRELARAYDVTLASAGVDVLAMPTVPVLAPPAVEVAELSRTELIRRVKSGPRGKNTSPFDVTGHPAITVPCGDVDGLPVGLMLVGARYDDSAVLRAAHAFEQSVGWDPA